MLKKYCIITYGCQMNVSDSERITAFLELNKYEKTEGINRADLIVVNACSVRQSAIDRVYGIARKLKEERKRRKFTAILTGCVLDNDCKKLSDGFDYILAPQNFDNWPKAIITSGKVDFFNTTPQSLSKFSASIPITKGCNNFCTYCVVPYTKGREESREVDNIVSEVKCFTDKGYKEIWLLGQNVNSYQGKNERKQPVMFPELLRIINDIPGNFWIRFTSSHPKDFSDKLIEAMATCKKITPYLNLPLQSGDNEILKKMNRPYTAGQYEKIISKVRKQIPNIVLSTDVIVGFPGETKKQFLNTAKLFKRIGYDMAYISKYSPRKGTKAAKIADNISLEEKSRRFDVLTDILRKSALEKNTAYLNKEMIVLPDSFSNGILAGKSWEYKTVKFKGPKSLIGKFITVKITNASPWSLTGEIVQQDLQYFKKKIIVIAGPTASGKSKMAVQLAKKFKGEIISADSRQVYQGMDIGSGKVTKNEMASIPHHLLDIVTPRQKFTVSDFQKLANKAIAEIWSRGKTPIICGGAWFYIKSLIEGMVIPEVRPDWNLRKSLEKLSTVKLFTMLSKRDPIRAKSIDRCNRRRLIRALEILNKNKTIPKIELNPISSPVLIIGIHKDQAVLDKLIKKRLLRRIDDGLIEEIKRLKKSGVSFKRLEGFGLEYRYGALYLQGKISYEETVNILAIKIHQFSKQQMTWLKNEKRIHWVNNYHEAEKLTRTFLSDKIPIRANPQQKQR
ncbi:MAG: tRNA (N6-isopentenyl adenosine(37)-C2)-methylthiotransferase MiaB [bacterium]